MLITDRNELRKYAADHRFWQGIPGVEVTRRGRIFVCFYSGGVREEIGNYALILLSDDGIHYQDPIAVAKTGGKRCYDPCLWIDPLDRLWFFWAESPENAVMAAVCDHPDAETPVFGEPRKISEDGMSTRKRRKTGLSSWKAVIRAGLFRESAGLIFRSAVSTSICWWNETTDRSGCTSEPFTALDWQIHQMAGRRSNRGATADSADRIPVFSSAGCSPDGCSS